MNIKNLFTKSDYEDWLMYILTRFIIPLSIISFIVIIILLLTGYLVVDPDSDYIQPPIIGKQEKYTGEFVDDYYLLDKKYLRHKKLESIGI